MCIDTCVCILNFDVYMYVVYVCIYIHIDISIHTNILIQYCIHNTQPSCQIFLLRFYHAHYAESSPKSALFDADARHLHR